MQRQRHAVELQFADVVDVFAAAEFVHAPFPVAQFVFAVGVVERQHRRGVRHFDESLARLAADALGGRIGRDQFWDARFQILQLLHQLVEFDVADLGIVENVIEILVVANFLAQRFDLLFDVFCGWHRRRLYCRERSRESCLTGEPREILRSA